ncbi:MAG: M20 family metallopeptidase [Ardenticatenales bacterium]|nr:M20 family metallopeptidase [Ardenticatenales bacterium]
MTTAISATTAQDIHRYLTTHQEAMTDFLRQLVCLETPSSVPASQAPLQHLLTTALRDLAYEVETIPGHRTGGHLLARPPAPADHPRQLLLGHSDTVWDVGTLQTMPCVIEDGKMRGPGVYDMKAGLAQMIFALRALRDLRLTPAVAPLVFVNSDEEIGSFESGSHIARLARQVARVLVLEPSLEPGGKLKTARKGVGDFVITVHGRAAHAGLEPEKGISAILEMARLIPQLDAMNDWERGVSVNVGLLSGGVRSNVIAPISQATVDVRIPTQADAERVTAKIRGLCPSRAGISLDIEGGINRMPLERTPRNRQLWHLARDLGRLLGLQLEQGAAGGGSDGNITSPYTATLDGLGAVGDGAHATHEFVYLDKMVERAALLALLILTEPPTN